MERLRYAQICEEEDGDEDEMHAYIQEYQSEGSLYTGDIQTMVR